MQPRVNGRFGSMPLMEKLDSKTTKTDNCWEWTASKNSAGYGLIFYLGKSQPAHRVWYEVAKGEIPKGLEIDHLCRNRSCVNPDHLEAVTHQVNVQRGIQGMLKTHCKYGHPLEEGNLAYFWSSRSQKIMRNCLKCSLRREAKAYANKKLKLKLTKESEL